jgi:hypothetical protein
MKEDHVSAIVPFAVKKGKGGMLERVILVDGSVVRV